MCRILPVCMDTTDKKETGILTYAGRLLDAGNYILPALVGLLMIVWGLFLDAGNWVLVIIGLALFLGFSWYAYQAITGKDA